MNTTHHAPQQAGGGPHKRHSAAERESHARAYAADPRATGDIARWSADNGRWQDDVERFGDESGTDTGAGPAGR